MENAITVKDVTKIYKLYDKPIDRLKEALNPFHKEYHKKFYALNNLSFEVKKGETVGIIGTNGSGKSTVIKAIVGGDLKDHYRSPDADNRGGGGQWCDLCSSGAGRRFQYGLHRN